MSKRKKVRRNRKNLTIHFMPYTEISKDNTVERIKKIMGLVLKNKIVVLQGRLRPDEEARLIENSMTLIGNIKGFQGIEIASISGNGKYLNFFTKFKQLIARMLVGNTDALTIIGPASIVKEITRDPRKLEFMLKG